MKLSLTIIFLFVFTLYIENSFSSANNEIDEKKEPNKYAPLWFGPRVGRKKRNPVDDGFKNFAEKEEVEVLLDFIRRNPWTILLFGNGKSRVINYNPREILPEEDEFTEMVQRSMFAPRLGRSAFYPRLGRGNEITD